MDHQSRMCGLFVICTFCVKMQSPGSTKTKIKELKGDPWLTPYHTYHANAVRRSNHPISPVRGQKYCRVENNWCGIKYYTKSFSETLRRKTIHGSTNGASFSRGIQYPIAMTIQLILVQHFRSPLSALILASTEVA